ncbi:MAG: aldo/keto reductase [Alphaproteobacteria bacterium]|nr:aldo/keto reductase [Alphaproteobacteria bacterium]MCB9930731.1 aldo/keto reductase [Alphaproteobacteria bacterium]
MDYVPFGRTGLTVSVAGLGCGGNSQLGLGRGKSEADAVRLVRAAHDLGVTLFDTAEAYGTEGVVGEAARRIGRDKVVIASKCRMRIGEDLISAGQFQAKLDASLKALGTDYVDIYQLHAVTPAMYDHVAAEIVPALQQAKAAGKLRHIGITETSPHDPHQRMLQRALQDDVWESAMFGFHMLNQGARRDVFPLTAAKGVGTLLMFVVRNIFSQPGLLQETVQDLAAAGQLPPDLAADPEPLGFLLHEGGATSIIDAAYRYARHEPGAHVTLFGTSDIGHLEANIASILRPPLPEADRVRLVNTFGHLHGVGLDLPNRVKPPQN